MPHTASGPAAPRPRPSRPLRAAVALTLAAALSACGEQGIRSVVGVELDPPNPFNVLPHKPLRLPSDLAHLPEPQPGRTSPLEPRPLEEARAALRAQAPGGSAPSVGELALLDAAGAEGAQTGIRETLAGEEPKTDQQYGLTTFLGYRIPDGATREILDQRKEADRLRAKGGLTPTAPPRPPELGSNEIILGGF